MYEKAILLIQGRSFKQAKPLLEQAIEQFRELKKNDELSEALTFLVQTKWELGEFRASMEVSAEAAILMRKEGDVHGEMRLELLDGDHFAEIQMYDHAITCYKNAAASATAFDDKFAFADAQIKLAYILKINGNFDEAQRIYQNVLAQAQATNDFSHIVAALCGVGSVYRFQQRYSEATNSLTQALVSTGQVRDPILVAQVQMEIGQLHLAQNSLNASLRDFRDAINTLRRARAGKDLETILLFRIGLLYEKNEKLPEAKKCYAEALEAVRVQGDRIAEYYLSFFLARCDVLILTSESPSRKRERVLQSYEQIAKNFQECRHATGEGFIYTQIAQEFEQSGDLRRARDWYIKATMLDQKVLAEYNKVDAYAPFQSALGISSSHIEWYELLSKVDIKLKQSDEALKTIEFGRLKQYAATFQNLEIFLRHPVLKQQTKNVQTQLLKAKLLETEYSARFSNTQRSCGNAEIKALRSELDSTKHSILKSSWQIVNDFPNYDVLAMPGRVEPSEIQKHIPSGSLAIEFLPTSDTLYIFALTNSRFVIRSTQVKRDSVQKLMEEYRRLLQDPAVYSGDAGEASVALMTRFAILSTRLYEILLGPIDDLFERNLIIVADKMVDGFPFHAIEHQDANGNVKYVIEITSVDYVPSLASLRYREVSYTRPRDVVVFGNPTGKNWSVDYELRDIRSFFKNARVMVGLEASWDNLKSIKADILQISTEFNQKSVEFPLGNMVLSNGLIVEESETVSFAKLTELSAAPIVILSNQYGQGIGLCREHALLLHLNGTSDVFLNAWPANRRAAKFFSENFFTLLASGLAPGDAYRQALLNLIRTREVNHPHSWAQFFHYGVG